MVFYKSKDPNELVIHAGEWDFQLEDKTYPVQSRLISKIIKHENYEDNLVFNDIALIFVTEPFVITYHVGTICLPPQDFDFIDFNSQICTTSGWGKDTFGKKKIN